MKWLKKCSRIAFVVLFVETAYGTMETSLQSEELLEEGQFYTSHPTDVRVIKTDYRHQSINPETLLRVTMETTSPDWAGGRKRNLFFSQQHVAEYVEALDKFIRMSRDATVEEKQEIARLPSWESFQVKRDLIFDYIPPGNRKQSNAENVSLLGVSLVYDVEHRGGSFYFTPANAQELLNLLFTFISDV